MLLDHRSHSSNKDLLKFVFQVIEGAYSVSRVGNMGKGKKKRTRKESNFLF